MQDVTFRRAEEEDLFPATMAWYATELVNDPGLRAPRLPLSSFQHVLSTGDLFVAEGAGRVIGFAGSVRRGDVRFLTDLFVHPRAQGAGVGKRLLALAMEDGAPVRCTVSSGDHRAQALYISAGMAPRWPFVDLVGEGSSIATGEGKGLTLEPADPGDPELVEMDGRISGRRRPQDLSYLIGSPGGEARWVVRGGRRAGYALVRRNDADSMRRPLGAVVGPVGVEAEEDAVGAVAAAVRLAAERAPTVEIGLPGSHPALRPALEWGFHIEYTDLFVCSEDREVFDARRYVPSGGDLL